MRVSLVNSDSITKVYLQLSLVLTFKLYASFSVVINTAVFPSITVHPLFYAMTKRTDSLFFNYEVAIIRLLFLLSVGCMVSLIIHREWLSSLSVHQPNLT